MYLFYTWDIDWFSHDQLGPGCKKTCLFVRMLHNRVFSQIGPLMNDVQ